MIRRISTALALVHSGVINLSVGSATTASSRTVSAVSIGMFPLEKDRIMRVSLAALAVLVSLALPVNAQVGHAGSDTIRLNLRQCLERAMTANLDVRQSALVVEMAYADKFRADMSRWLPIIRAEGLSSVVQDAKGSPLNDNYSTSWDNFGPFWQFTVEAGQPLATFGRISNSRKAADFGVKARKAEVGQRRAKVASEVYKLYYGILLARELLDILDDATDKVRSARNKVSTMLRERSEKVTTIDLARLDVYSFELESKRLKAKKSIALALGALQRATGIPYDTAFDVEHGRLRRSRDEIAPLDSLRRCALTMRPEINAVNAAVKGRKYQVAAAEAERYPILYLGMRAKYFAAPGREIQQYENPFIGDGYNKLSVGAAVGLTYDIDWPSVESKIRKARIKYKEMVRMQAWARASIALEVQKAHLEATEAETNAALGRRSLKAGRAWLVQTIDRYDIGVSSTSDLLTAYGAYAKSQSDYYQTLYDHYLALAELYRTVGYPIWKAGKVLDPPAK
jgi:outer membrane protein TolC